MGKQDDLLDQWRQQPAPSARVAQVQNLLQHFFGAGFSLAQGGSHQLRVSHEALKSHPHFGGGKLSIPVSGGQTVKPFYLKRVVLAVSLLNEFQAQQQSEKKNDNEDDK